MHVLCIPENYNCIVINQSILFILNVRMGLEMQFFCFKMMDD